MLIGALCLTLFLTCIYGGGRVRYVGSTTEMQPHSGFELGLLCPFLMKLTTTYIYIYIYTHITN